MPRRSQILKALTSAKGRKLIEVTEQDNNKSALNGTEIKTDNDTALLSIDTTGTTADVTFKAKRYPYLKTMKIGSTSTLDVPGHVEDLWIEDVNSIVDFTIYANLTYHPKQIHFKDAEGNWKEFPCKNNLDIITQILVRKYDLEKQISNALYSLTLYNNDIPYTPLEITLLYWDGITSPIKLLAVITNNASVDVPSTWTDWSCNLSAEEGVTINKNEITIDTTANGSVLHFYGAVEFEILIGASKNLKLHTDFVDKLTEDKKNYIKDNINTNVIDFITRNSIEDTLINALNNIEDPNIFKSIISQYFIWDSFIQNSEDTITFLSDYTDGDNGLPECYFVAVGDNTPKQGEIWKYLPKIEYSKFNVTDCLFLNLITKNDQYNLGLAAFYEKTVQGGEPGVANFELCKGTDIGSKVGTLAGYRLLITRNFIPEQIPTKLKISLDEGGIVFVNNVQIYTSESWLFNNIVDYDFSTLIKTGVINNITIALFGGGPPNGVNGGFIV